MSSSHLREGSLAKMLEIIKYIGWQKKKANFSVSVNGDGNPERLFAPRTTRALKAIKQDYTTNMADSQLHQPNCCLFRNVDTIPGQRKGHSKEIFDLYAYSCGAAAGADTPWTEHVILENRLCLPPFSQSRKH